MTTSYQLFDTTLYKTAKRFCTSLPLWTLLKLAIHNIRHNIPFPTTLPVSFYPIDDTHQDLPQLWQDQLAIGWHHLHYGRLSYLWMNIQQRVYNTIPPSTLHHYHTATHWANATVSTLILQSIKIWHKRCNIKKGHNFHDTAQLEHLNAMNQYLHIISTKHLWPPHYHQALSNEIPLPQKASTATLRAWILTYEALTGEPYTIQPPLPPHQQPNIDISTIPPTTTTIPSSTST